MGVDTEEIRGKGDKWFSVRGKYSGERSEWDKQSEGRDRIKRRDDERRELEEKRGEREREKNELEIGGQEDRVDRKERW